MTFDSVCYCVRYFIKLLKLSVDGDFVARRRLSGLLRDQLLVTLSGNSRRGFVFS